MKKGLIKEAFRLQQLAGIAPINEIFGTDNDQYLGKYSDIYSRVTVSDEGVYSAKDPSDQEAVRLADALTALYDEHGENGIDAWQSGAIDIEDYMDNVEEGFDSTKYVEQGIQNLLKIAKDALLQGAKEEGIKLDETVYSGDITSGGPGGNLQDYSDIEKSSYFDLVSQLLDDYESVLRNVVEEDGFNGNWEEYYSNNEPVFVEGSESIESWWDDEEILMPDMIVVTYDSGIENYVWKAERYEKAI